MKKILAIVFVALFTTIGLVSCKKEPEPKEITQYEVKDSGTGDIIDFNK